MRHALDYMNKSRQNDVKLREIKLEKETISRPLDTPLARKERKKKDSRIDIFNDREREAHCLNPRSFVKLPSTMTFSLSIK